MMAAFGFPSHMEDKNKNAPSAYPIRRQITPTNVVRPAKTVFLDVRPPLENLLTEQEFIQTMKPIQAFENIYPDDMIYENMKPVINVMRFMGGFPFKQNSSGYFSFRFMSSIMFYSIFIYLLILAYVVWVLMHRIDIKETKGDKKSGESTGGKFEEAVIAYLFFVYLLPIISIPILWFETSKVVGVFNDWRKFEVSETRNSPKPKDRNIEQNITLDQIIFQSNKKSKSVHSFRSCGVSDRHTETFNL